MTKERQIEILMMDCGTRSDAEKHLKNGSVIFDGEDFQKHFESYMDELDADEEERARYRAMVDHKKSIPDWGIVEDGGKTYYIMYAL